MNDNMCKFVPTRNVMDNINILNFVYEKKAEFKQNFLIPASHALHIVTNGCGTLHTSFGNYQIKSGDLFFTFSAKPYFIEKDSDLSYIYISFIGLRTSGLFERLCISYTSPVYSGYKFLIKRWEEDFKNANKENIDLICEGLLLSTLSFLCQYNYEEHHECYNNGILTIKQYVDLNYTNEDLNLKTVSNRFGYNFKYVSSTFSKMMKISFSKYLKKLRLSHAISLMNNGMTNVQEISSACGYRDSFHFSTVFRESYGISPKAYIKSKR